MRNWILAAAALCLSLSVSAEEPSVPWTPQPNTSNLASAFNPAIGMAIDMVGQKQDSQNSLLFRSAELNIESYIDPFLKGAAVITGTDGQSPTVSGGTPTIDVEEAWLQTTSLPGNLRLTGGRMFASFGRLEHFHDHELPVINRPNSIDSYIGGESRADGVEINFLFPTDQFIEADAGVFDKIGATNNRVDPAGSRPWPEFSYLGHLHSYFDIGDDHSLDVGLSNEWVPMQDEADIANGPLSPRAGSYRMVSGADITYRWHPVRGGLYRGLLWSTEVLRNDEESLDPATNLPLGRHVAWGGFSYIEYKSGRHFRPGVLVDLTENPSAPSQLTRTYTAYLTCDVTEFQRLRVQYSRIDNNIAGAAANDYVGLQWTGVFGHHVHGFRDR